MEVFERKPTMQPTHMMLLYVKDPIKTAAFYTKVLGCEPIEASPGFAMFPLNPHTVAGFWKRDAVEPKVSAEPGGSEIGFHVASEAEVDARFEQLKSTGAAILQTPVKMDFGYTFTAADPDGHRLRVFAPA
jgi:predicted enzyme related to lactoylglutathione lyase